MIAPAIHQLAELCAAKGIEHVILCPGSRSAPLTLAFLRTGKFSCYTLSDERSAAFVALGIAQHTQRPVVLVCTSGSAAYNFAPAVAEALFQQIPLVVITADRPREWIDQLDGQTIRQQNLYGQHVKRFLELPQDYTHEDASWYANRITNEAINLAEALPKGPVHINAPFREPLYPGIHDGHPVTADVRVIEKTKAQSTLSESEWATILAVLRQKGKILLVAGQAAPHPAMVDVLTRVQEELHLPIAGDILSNLHGLSSACLHTDTFLGQLPESKKSELKPDLLITFGQSLVAKHLKVFLRQYQPREHWHVQAHGESVDTFKTLTRVLPVDPVYFFSELLRRGSKSSSEQTGYASSWLRHEKQARQAVASFFQEHDQGEFALVNTLLQSLPERCNLHLANSMSVRYANHIGLIAAQKDVTVFSNRGTSGIDGCSSTAVGHALVSTVPNVLITGDQAFFYDRNAFWHNYPLPHLFVVVLNNHGGIIFNLIDGPANLPEAEEYFVTRQMLRAASLANEFGFRYSNGNSAVWKEFFKPGNVTKIHELESAQSLNKSKFEAFRKHIKNSYEA